MDKELNSKKENKKKGFFTRLVEKIDREMKGIAKENKCCSGKDNGGNSCCS